MTVRAGLDLSMTSPVICVHDDNTELNFKNCKFYSFGNFSGCNQLVGQHSNINIMKQPSFTHNLERYQKISHWVQSIVKLHNITKVSIEDYSFNSKGKVFNIAEMTGIVKYDLFRSKIIVNPIDIPTIKKTFSDKGNAGKDVMYKAFEESQGILLHEILGIDRLNLGKKQRKDLEEGNFWELKPIDDIVDSFAVLYSSYQQDKIGG